MEVSKKNKSVQREKHQRFSIRKFNVGVASVAIAAFWMVSGAQAVSATEVVENGGADIVQIAPAEEAVVEEDEEPAQAEPVAETAAETPVVEELAEETPAAETAEVAPAEAEETVEEVQEETKDVPAEEADKKEETAEETKAEEKKEDSSAISTEKATETKAETVAAPVTRVAATTYRVQYVDVETGEMVKQRNESVNEATTAAADEKHTFNVTVELDVPAGYVAVAASNNAGQEFAIVNNAIAAAVVEKDSSSRTIKIAIRKDDVTATNNNDEGYTALRKVADDYEAPVVPYDTVGDDIAISEEWKEAADGTKTIGSEDSLTKATNKASDTSITDAKEKATVKLRDITKDLDYEKDAANPIDTSGFELDPNEGRTTILIGYLGNPYDAGTDELDTVKIKSDDYNERNELDYYITVSVDAENNVYFRLVSKENGFIEEKVTKAGDSTKLYFDTLTEIQNTKEATNEHQSQHNGVVSTNNKYNLNYALNSTGDETNGYTVQITGTIMKGFKSSRHPETGEFQDSATDPATGQSISRAIKTFKAGETRVLTNNEMVYIYNLAAKPAEGSRQNHFSADLPSTVTQNNYYRVVDYATYQEYQENGESYLSQATGDEIQLAHLEQKGTKGNVFTIADELDFEDYDIVETPAKNMSQIDGVLTDHYTVGTRTVTNTAKNGILKISEITSTTGAATTEIWILDINKEGWSAYHPGSYPAEQNEDILAWLQTITDPAELEKAFTKVYQSDVLEPGEYNTEWSSFDFLDPNGDGDESDSMIDKYRLEDVRNDNNKRHIKESIDDADLAAIQANVVAGKASTTTENQRYGHTQPKEKNTYGQYRVPTIVEKGDKVTDGDKEFDTIQIGGTNQTLQNENQLNVQNVYWFYAEKGSVIVHYEDVDGNPIVQEKDANGQDVPLVNVDTDHGKTGSTYNTADSNTYVDGQTVENNTKPTSITAEDGTTYWLVEDVTTNTGATVKAGTKQDQLPEDSIEDNKKVTYTAEETGSVEMLTDKHITYVYQKGGDVVVYYKDEQGNPISGSVSDLGDKTSVGTSEVDTLGGKPGESYDTTDLKPSRIVTSTGDVYELIADRIDGQEKGDTIESGATIANNNPKEVTYYYRKVQQDSTTGGVVVNYVDINGTTIKESVVNTDPSTPTGVGYNTVDKRDETITTQDGKVYRRVPAGEYPVGSVDGASHLNSSDAIEGTVVEGIKSVTYVYELVKGDVVVNYYAVDKDGQPVTDADGSKIALQPSALAEDGADTGNTYDVTGYKDTYIVKDGKIYQRVDLRTDAEGKQVNPHPVTDGIDENGAEVANNETGTVKEGTQIINYYYEEVPASVDVAYYLVDEDGNLKTTPRLDENGNPVLDENNQIIYDHIQLQDKKYIVTNEPAGTEYDIIGRDENNEEYRPEVIKTPDGKIYQRHIYNDGNAGKVPVLISYPDKTGYSDDKNDREPAAYTYHFIQQSTGNLIVNDTTHYNYFYKEVQVSDVVVNYYAVTKDGDTISFLDGTPLKDSQTVATLANLGEEYKTVTEDLKPDYITRDEVKDGQTITKTYKRVDLDKTNPRYTEKTETDGIDENGNPVANNETGTVKAGTQEVNYYYEQVTGNVHVRYYAVDENGAVIEFEDSKYLAPQQLAKEEGNIGDDYDATTEELAPKEIVKDGVTYKRVDINNTNPKAANGGYTDGDSVTGQVENRGEDGDQIINYYYEAVKGNVVVHYVDLNGNVLQAPYADTTNGNIGKIYDAEEGTDDEAEKTPSIMTNDGKVYFLTKKFAMNNGQSIQDSVLAYDEDVIEGTGKDKQIYTSETVGEVVEGTTHITYVYEEAGSVIVHYKGINDDGTEIDLAGDTIGIDKAKVSSTEYYIDNKESGTSYDTKVLRPKTITDANGDTWYLTESKTTGDPETGTVESGKTKEVTYKYVKEQPKGSVEVNYYAVDENGNKTPLSGAVNEADTLKDNKTVVEVNEKDITDADAGTAYDTTDLRPSTITDKDGTIWYLVEELTDGDKETGEVESDKTKQVNYYYKKATPKVEEVKGNVTVRYVDTEGNELQDPYTDTKDKLVKTTTTMLHPVDGTVVGRPTVVLTNANYDTAETETEKPKEITKDGKVYRLVPAGDYPVGKVSETNNLTETTTELGKDAVKGDVVEGSKEVTYVYELVTGGVTARYVIEGTEVEIADQKTVKSDDTPINENYTDAAPKRITTKDGVTYELVRTRTNEGDEPADGTVKEDDQVITYEYKVVTGEVVARYVIEGTETEIADQTTVTEDNTPINADYTDAAPNRITTKDGKVYELVRTRTNEGDAPTDGKVTEVEQTITYEYKEVTGDVEVAYVDTKGNVLQPTYVDTEKGSLSDTYNTAENATEKPAEIKVGDKVYRLAPAGAYTVGTVTRNNNLLETDTTLGTDAVTGKVEEETQKITYVYKEVTGDVTVEHVSDKGEVLSPTEDVKKDSSLGETYETKDKGRITTEDGRVFTFKEVAEDSDPTSGKVTEDPQHVKYVYEEVKGSVTVEHVSDTGEVLIPTEDVVRDVSLNETYETSDKGVIRTTDGRVFVFTKVADDSAPTSGDVKEEDQHVKYVYTQVFGDVVVDYVDTYGNPLQATYTDTDKGNPGENYNTYENTTEKPAEIKVGDKVYRLAPVGDYAVGMVGRSNNLLDAKYVDGKLYGTDDIDGQVVQDETLRITYVYEEVTGSVTVEHKSVDGTVILREEAPVVTDQSLGTDYTTSPEEEITTPDGRVFRFVKHDETSEPTDGKVKEDDQKVVYLYEEVKGSVTVEHVSDTGEVLIPTEDVKRDVSLNETYETKDEGTIVTKDGRVFKFTKVADDSATPTGDVEEGTKHVKYVYTQVVGNVTVDYVDTYGNPLQATYTDTSKGNPDQAYNTEENAIEKPAEIKVGDKVYRLVPAGNYPVGSVGRSNNLIETASSYGSDAVEGTVVGEATQRITFVYEEVKGSVTVEHISDTGEVLIPTADVKRDVSLDETYTTKPNEETVGEETKQRITTADGRVFDFVKHDETSDAPSGKVEEADQHVVYIYKEVKGTVTVEHVAEDGTVLSPTEDVVRDGSLNETYSTSDKGVIRTTDGRVFVFKKVADESAPTSGTVTEEPQHVKYVYAEVTGNVEVSYVDTEGNVLQPTYADTTAASLNKSYDTAENTTEKPTEIKVGDKVYRLVPAGDYTVGTVGRSNNLIETATIYGTDAVTGAVQEGTQRITYVYQEVKGSVTVEHVSDTGEVLVPTESVKKDSSLGETYETADKGKITTEDGRVFTFTKVADESAPTSGKVTEEPQHVKYVYTEVKGNVTVEHISDTGEVLIPTADVKRGESIGVDYTTSDEGVIVTEDGRVFTFTKVADTSAPVDGKVAQEDQHVVYVYTEVKGDVVVNYIDTKGNVIKAPVVDTPESSIKTPYDTTDNKPETITVVDENGTTRTYRRVPNLIIGDETGSVVEGRTEITYVYEEVIPETPVGSVVVRYHIVDENGNVIVVDAQTKVNDTVDADAGTDYDTTDYRPATIIVDGVTYDLVAELTTDAETGSVEAGVTKEVNYHYVKRAETPVTTVWVLSDGTVIRPLEDGTLPKDAFEGYVFVETVVDENGNTTHIFKPLTTVWVTVDGTVLRPLEDGTLPKDAFEGYNFVETIVDEEGNTTHIFKPVTTVWVTVDGTVLRPLEDGTLPKDAFEGYNFVETVVDENGNTVHIFKPVEVKPVTTIWVTVDGTVLRPLEDGTLPKDAFEGYEFVRTVVDADGNTIHIFKPVKPTETKPSQPAKSTPAPKYVTKETKALPNTGEAENSAVLTGLGMMFAAAGLVARRRRKED